MDSDNDDSDDEEKQQTTGSGRAVNQPTRYRDKSGEIGASIMDYKMMLTMAETHYNASMNKLQEEEFVRGKVCCVGAGIGDGFENSKELQVMKFK